MQKRRFSFADITRLTRSEGAAIALAEKLRWGASVACHRCESKDVARLADRPGRYRCRACHRQFSIRTGTPMEQSKLPVSIWMRALWLIVSSSKGISSLKLGEMLGIQQKSAWFLAHRVREMMAWLVRRPIAGTIVELDEVYAGAPPRQKAGGGPSGAPSGRGPRRPLVLTAAVRGGEARMKVIGSHSRAEIEPATREMVAEAETFATDALPAYGFLGRDRRTVKHSAKEFARTDPDGLSVHVNTVEGIHGELRRMVVGVHHWISSKHLQRYLDDLSFRRSLRELDARAKMRIVLTGRGRLHYADLVGIPF
jgi:transposase-like protein